MLLPSSQFYILPTTTYHAATAIICRQRNRVQWVADYRSKGRAFKPQYGYRAEFLEKALYSNVPCLQELLVGEMHCASRMGNS